MRQQIAGEAAVYVKPSSRMQQWKDYKIRPYLPKFSQERLRSCFILTWTMDDDDDDDDDD